MLNVKKFCLIISSLLPLFVLMLVRILCDPSLHDMISDPTDLFSHPLLYTLLIVSIFIMVGIISLLYYRSKNNVAANNRSYCVRDSRDKTNLGFDFFVTLIIPLVMINIDSIASTISFFLILFFIIMLMWRSTLYYSNPMLIILGYSIYDVNLDEIGNCHILSKKDVKEGDLISILLIEDDVYCGYVNKGNKNE